MPFQGQRRENAMKWGFQETFAHLALVQESKGHKLTTSQSLIPGRFSHCMHPLNLVRASVFSVFTEDEPQEKYPAQSREKQKFSPKQLLLMSWLFASQQEKDLTHPIGKKLSKVPGKDSRGPVTQSSAGRRWRAFFWELVTCIISFFSLFMLTFGFGCKNV